MYKVPQRLFCIVLLALLSACATSATKPANPAVVARMKAIDRTKSATVVIYRPSAHMGYALHPTVVLDGKDLINIGNGKVFVAPINPGHYVFEMDDKHSGTDVTLKAGQDVYMKIEIVPGMWVGGGKLTQMAPEQGAYEATRLELIEPNQIEIASFR